MLIHICLGDPQPTLVLVQTQRHTLLQMLMRPDKAEIS